jgi:hypothetical protein
MRHRLPNFAENCDRYQVSNRAAASIASLILKDVNIITPSDKKHIVDKSKVKREIKKIRMELTNEFKSQPSALYFDGRKDLTK